MFKHMLAKFKCEVVGTILLKMANLLGIKRMAGMNCYSSITL